MIVRRGAQRVSFVDVPIGGSASQNLLARDRIPRTRASTVRQGMTGGDGIAIGAATGGAAGGIGAGRAGDAGGCGSCARTGTAPWRGDAGETVVGVGILTGSVAGPVGM